MTYVEKFRHADEMIDHLNDFVPELSDQLLQAKYKGFVSVAAVTVYEMAMKDIFIQFSRKKHKVLGNFTEEYFDRINGRIKLNVIKSDYISKFGEKYLIRFKKKIEMQSKKFLRIHRRDIRSSYGNLITWRNEFAHAGQLNKTATYQEVIQSYQDGKEVLHCLAETMKR